MIGFDAYDRGARLAPAYLVLSPLAVFVFSLAIGSPTWWSKLGGILIACGGPLLAAHWGRAGGRTKQPALFAAWGGSPTTRLLRYSTGGLRATVDERHAVVERATGVSLPSESDEHADPEAAEARYESASARLRELTRGDVFPLVLKENTSYGFRRNLWARKPYGIVVAALVSLASAVLLVVDAVGREVAPTGSALVPFVYGVLALVVRTMMVTPEWVRDAAEAYATRLLESAVRVPPHGA
ncbi:MAG: hypothetical protein ACRDOP_10155 [Gaiellaceae bacterium]